MIKPENYALLNLPADPGWIVNGILVGVILLVIMYRLLARDTIIQLILLAGAFFSLRYPHDGFMFHSGCEVLFISLDPNREQLRPVPGRTRWFQHTTGARSGIPRDWSAHLAHEFLHLCICRVKRDLQAISASGCFLESPLRDPLCLPRSRCFSIQY